MFKKPCPWCDSKISLWQLGKRRRKTITFLTVNNNLLICPHCAKAVKLSGKSLYLFGALVPFFIFPFISMFTDIDILAFFPVNNMENAIFIGYPFIFVVFLTAIGFSRFKKDPDL